MGLGRDLELLMSLLSLLLPLLPLLLPLLLPEPPCVNIETSTAT